MNCLIPAPFVLVMVAGCVLLLAAVPARSQDAHGAIAFGRMDQAVAYGFAWDYPERDEAQEAAMDACLSAGGGSACTVLAWFQNSCGALAMDQYGMAQGKGARTQEQAEARALATCEAAGGVGCAVVGSQCVSAGGQADTWSGSEIVLAARPEEGSGSTEDRPTADAPRGEGRTRDELSVAREAKEPDGPRNQVVYIAAAGPKCAELESYAVTEHGFKKYAACWQAIQGQPGCHIWRETDHYSPVLTADWTGECSGDTAHGQGKLVLFDSEEGEPAVTASGAFMHGKQNGHWVFRYAHGAVHEGPYVDGKRQGHWVIRADIFVGEGPYVDSMMNGHWVFRWGNGGVDEGPYIGGERHGHWVEREADGGVDEGPYVDGERHGHWVMRDADGGVDEGFYVDGERHGHWVKRGADGGVDDEGPYVSGERHGRWLHRVPSGHVLEREWRNGSIVD